MAESRRWRLAALSAALVAALALLAVLQTRATGSPAKGVAEIVDGPDGVPVVDYGGELGVQENPVTVAQWALIFDGDVIVAADWLIDRQQPDGSWRYGFDWSVSRGRVHLGAGWPSAMAQGQALSVFAKAYEESGDERYVRAARRAFHFLMLPVAEGGVRTSLDGDLWLAEYPSDPPAYVLNGFLFTLQGLDDAAHITPGAAEVFDAGYATVREHLGRWDSDGVVSYDLVHETIGGPVWHNPRYDSLHADLLADLLERRPNAHIARWQRHWFG